MSDNDITTMHHTCDDCESLRFDGWGRRICNVHGEQLCNHQRCENFQKAEDARQPASPKEEASSHS